MKQVLAFVLFSSIICWMMFSPIYKHVLIMRQALLQQEVDYLLEVGASGKFGYISPAMINASKQRLSTYGLSSEQLQYTVLSTEGRRAQYADERVTRGAGIELTVTYPFERLTTIDTLVGIEPIAADSRMRAYGVQMSEYVE